MKTYQDFLRQDIDHHLQLVDLQLKFQKSCSCDIFLNVFLFIMQ